MLHECRAKCLGVPIRLLRNSCMHEYLNVHNVFDNGFLKYESLRFVTIYYTYMVYNFIHFIVMFIVVWITFVFPDSWQRCVTEKVYYFIYISLPFIFCLNQLYVTIVTINALTFSTKFHPINYQDNILKCIVFYVSLSHIY